MSLEVQFLQLVQVGGHSQRPMWTGEWVLSCKPLVGRKMWVPRPPSVRIISRPADFGRTVNMSVLDNLNQLNIRWEKGASVEKMLHNWCWRAQPIVGRDTHGPVVLGAVRKQTGQATMGSPVSSTLPGSRPAGFPVLTSFSDTLRCGSVCQVNPFLPVAIFCT